MSDAYLTKLPEELLEAILAYVKDTGSSIAFRWCLQTCRQWHRIGLGLYKSLGFAACAVIESDARRYSVFAENTYQDPLLEVSLRLEVLSEAYMSLLRSLTIHVQHQGITTSRIPSSGRDLIQPLKKLFAQTPSLTTFSFRTTDGWDFPSLDVPAIPHSLLARLVRALPETIVHLELDTASTDVPPRADRISHDQDDHLCFQISRIVVRLQRLRLKVGHTCEALLSLRPDADDCDNVDCCDHCHANEQATCNLISRWNMRTLVVWLPWGESILNNTFAIAAHALLDPTFRNPTIVLLVCQTDHHCPDRQSITKPSSSPYLKFTWSVQSNVSLAIRNRLDEFRFKSIWGRSLNHIRQQPLLSPQPKREFILNNSLDQVPEAGTTTAYPYVAEHEVEQVLSWTQNSHLGYRFPFSESSVSCAPYWKTTDRWACLFPECKTRRQSTFHLAGHHMFAHPKYPWHDTWDGHEPCTITGCDRVGRNGFKIHTEREQHILSHYAKSFPLVTTTTS